MDEMYGFESTSEYADKALMSPENLMMQAAELYNYHNYSTPLFGSEDAVVAVSSEAASFTPHHHHHIHQDHDDDVDASTIIKSKIASHPYYPKLLHAFIDCQKVGAPPEISSILEEMKQQNDFRKQNATTIMCIGADPELDEFMETYCDILLKYKSDLSKPFDEATTFLNNIELQLSNLCTDDGGVSSDEELSCGDETAEASVRSGEDNELKDRLLRKFGSHLSSLKLEFSKKKKKGKLPKESRQILLSWWSDHYRWPYPTEADKNSLAETTGLDPKQINNWFINQRKRHWKPSENMQLAVMDNLSTQFFSSDD